MRKALAVAIVLCFAGSIMGYGGDLKVGYADIVKVFNDYQKTKDYEKVLDEKKKKKEAESNLEEKKNEIIKMQDKLELLKDREKEQQKEKIRKAVNKYRDLEAQKYSDLKKESNEKMKEIIKDINKAISNYAKSSGFDLILNKSAILYGKDGIDVTDSVLKKLNEGYKVK